MTPVFGNHTSSQVSSGSSQSFSHTNNGNMVVARILLIGNAATPTGFSVTYAGVGMTEIASKANGNQIAKIFIYYGAPSGANTFSVSWTNAVDGLCAISSMSYSLYRTPVTATVGGSPASVTCPTTPGDMVVEAGCCSSSTTYTAINGQTTQDNVSPTANIRTVDSYLVATSTSTTVSWTQALGRAGIEIGVAFYDPPSAGAPVTISPFYMI